MIQAILFDLDDTLYPENEFALGGYKAVARAAAASGGCGYEEAFDCMQNAFRADGRKEVFPLLIKRFPGLGIELEELVRVYREHVPEISLFPGYGDILEELGKTYRLGMITDGLPAVQRSKVRALGIEEMFEKIVYSWDYGEERQKPHLYPFALILEALGVSPHSTLFVGDNREKDGRGALGAGMRYVRVEYRDLARTQAVGIEQRAVDIGRRALPDEIVIQNLRQLPQVLMRLQNENWI